MMTPETLGAEETDPIRVGSFFLETLTTGMYENAFHCIREYVQNSYDAILEAVRSDLIKEKEGRVLISVGGNARTPSLSIRDNGCGIPLDAAYTTLVSLGASGKNPTRHAGFRGIGRLAGIAYCTTLRFKTKTKGEARGTVVEFDCGLIKGYLKPGSDFVDVRDVIRTSVKTNTFSESSDQHYTEVEMSGLVGLGQEFVQMELLQPYLRQVCPVSYADNFDYSERIKAIASGFGDSLDVIEVEARQKREKVSIHKPYKNTAATVRTPSKLYEIETFVSKEHGWYGWIGKSNFAGEITDDTVAGVRFRMKNIQVGDSRIIMDIAEGLTPAGSERRLMLWAVGEIFVTNREVIPNARRDGFEDTVAWRKIRHDIKDQVAKRLVRLIRGASSSRSTLKRITNAFENLTAVIALPAFTADEKRRLLGEIKKQLDKLASDKLASADPKEVSSLVSRFKELQEKVTKAPTKETDQAPVGGKTASEATETNADVSADGETKPAMNILDIVHEVLVDELGDEEAQRLMDIIVARLE